MKNLLLALILPAIIVSCSNNKNKTTEVQELSDIEKIAKAYGIDNFNDLKQLQYTFNVARHDTLLVSRKWVWNKESGDIIMINQGDTVNYKQSDVKEDLKKTDHSFINDKYWLLFPFQLVWDKDMIPTNMGEHKAPISGQQRTKLTIQYGNEGGYTPGDAYDLYLDENWIIREWEFRKSGKDSPGSAISWEGYSDYNGIKVAADHNNIDSGLRIYFTDIIFE
jgi:hypothetical protein